MNTGRHFNSTTHHRCSGVLSILSNNHGSNRSSHILNHGATAHMVILGGLLHGMNVEVVPLASSVEGINQTGVIMVLHKLLMRVEG
jgi:hypothetical protein